MSRGAAAQPIALSNTLCGLCSILSIVCAPDYLVLARGILERGATRWRAWLKNAKTHKVNDS
eukprot:6178037-Pleurochrysis_carterae.AAC.2